jgi:hypothetical protein
MEIGPILILKKVLPGNNEISVDLKNIERPVVAL